MYLFVLYLPSISQLKIEQKDSILNVDFKYAFKFLKGMAKFKIISKLIINLLKVI